MMCELMPPIPESQCEETSSLPGSENGDETESNFEQLMISMLEERDKLTDKLKETEETLSNVQNKLEETEKERNLLSRQLDEAVPQECASLIRELAQLKDVLSDRNEEIIELKAERNNTRLLLEHLECLVSRHERSLRMTVVKRQSQNSSGVSSEVEVLKALKSLFEHHKALDEKVRERLRIALERCSELEGELDRSKKELEASKNLSSLTNDDLTKSFGLNDNGDAQAVIDRQMNELESSKSRIQDLNYRVKELDDRLSLIQKELYHSQDMCHKYQRDLKEALVQKEDQEQRIATLEKRYLSAQREATLAHEFSGKLEAEIASKDAALKHIEEKYQNLQEKYEIVEQKYIHCTKSNETCDNAAAKCGQMNHDKHLSSDEKIRQLMNELEDVKMELNRAKQRELMKDDHNSRLSATVDRLLSESNERVQGHLKERMQALEEKTNITEECENLRKRLDETMAQKARLQDDLEFLKREFDLNYKDSLKSHYDWDPNYLSCLPNTEILTAISGKKKKANTYYKLMDLDWENINQTHVVNDVRLAFESSDAEMNEDTSEKQVPSAYDFLTNRQGKTDVQALALLLQEQLDAINNEMRRIEMEKADTELRADQLESKVGTAQWQNSNRDDTLAFFNRRPCSPTSDRSAYKSNIDAMVKYATVPPNFSTRSCANFDKPTEKQNLHSMTFASPHQERSVATHYINCESSPPPCRKAENCTDDRLVLTEQSPVVSQHSSDESLFKQNFTSKKRSGLRTSLVKIFKSSKEKPQRVKSNFSSTYAPKAEILDPEPLDSSTPLPSLCKTDYTRRMIKKQELLDEAINSNKSFSNWDTATVVAWLELWVGMPAWYVAACRANVKSGAIMAALSDSEIQREIGISNPLHRLKLRLAIQEMVNFTSPSAPKTSTNVLAFKEMNHEWVGNEWLASLGLSQYRTYFMENLVDARMLGHLTKKDLRSNLKMVDSFHRTSLHFGISVLKKLNYDKHEIEKRRERCNHDESDVLVWTHERVIRWVNSIGLRDYSSNLAESGVHGGLIALDDTFDWRAFALALQIPTSHVQARQRLEQEFNHLLSVATDRYLTNVENHINREAQKAMKDDDKINSNGNRLLTNEDLT